jgi:hypothetical protein
VFNAVDVALDVRHLHVELLLIEPVLRRNVDLHVTIVIVHAFDHSTPASLPWCVGISHKHSSALSIKLVCTLKHFRFLDEKPARFQYWRTVVIDDVFRQLFVVIY